jgi:enterobactin synthetase component D
LPAVARARGVRDPLRVPRTVTVGVREVWVNPNFTLGLPHGHFVGVDIPPVLTDELRAALHPDELAYASAMGEGRQASFAAGRVALRAAIVAADPAAAARLSAMPYLPAPDGGPTLPPGVLASISHKRRLAVALAARAGPDAGAALGVDLEDDRPLRVDISRRVLTQGELRRAAALPPSERDRNLIQHFSLKEALYKAVNGFGLAPVTFHNVEVTQISSDGSARFAVPVLLQQQYAITGWIGNPIAGYVVASVQARAVIR